MKAIVEIQGHQYNIQAGDLIDVELLQEEVGKTLILKSVLSLQQEQKVEIGFPMIKDATIEAKVIKHDLAEKQIVLRRKPGKYMKKNGHRQKYTSLLITKIASSQGTSEIKKDSGRYKKYLDKKD